VADHQKSKVTAKELQRLEKQRKLAQTLRLKAEAEDSGEDLERRKAWEWSIEQNERWEAKMEDQRVRSDSRFHSESARGRTNLLGVCCPGMIIRCPFFRPLESAHGRRRHCVLERESVFEGILASSPASLESSPQRRHCRALDWQLAVGPDGPANPLVDAEDEAFKKYNRDIRNTKADLVAYERQKEAALGLAPGTLVPAGATSASLATSSRSKGLTASEDLYRGAHTLAYGDSKPREEAVDRVIGKINKEYVDCLSHRVGGHASSGTERSQSRSHRCACRGGGCNVAQWRSSAVPEYRSVADIRSMGKGKRKKNDDDDAEVNYINDRNKKFNQKVSRA
jgi:pre-mRNA-splicing factor SYF2